MKNRSKGIIWYAIWFVIFFLLSSYIESREDDLIFKAGIESYGSFGGWIEWFSYNWGGRIIPQGLLVLLLQLPSVAFHLLNALAWIILLFYVKKDFDIEDIFSMRFVCCIFPLLIFTFISSKILTGTVFWKCANVLYLWGSAALLVAVYPLIKIIGCKNITSIDYLFSIVGIVYASSFEQAAALMCGVFLLLLLYVLYSTHSVQWQIVVLSLLAFASAYFFSTLPGNGVRLKIEVLGQLSKYDMYSFLDKVLWGGWYVIHNIENEAIFIVIMLAITVVFLMQRNRKTKDPIMIGAYIMLGYFMLCTINQIGISNRGQEQFLSKLFRLIQIDSVEFGFSFSLALRSVVHFLVYVYLGCCILVVCPDKMEIIGFSFYFCSLASMWIMGFSPTIYASISRPRFLCYFFLLCVEIRIISSVMSSEKGEWEKLVLFLQKRNI